ncbi:helix-turn-helix domain-containing protein [Chamaesiphon minutus]|uniref:DNA-binding protein, excisionase family n=1 Tax=Chamaesiphon minutus (strain ATCC 27169 / PCC 6605) TaxID=1173020 RepID=K9UBY2_CHAP6|nr:helix-turn-helix domain-containing protein [Chamaesiphon minutus]AFY92320.1 DNA-binding protein, excisionase family [Chamaesiphon minutus PCC 6605]
MDRVTIPDVLTLEEASGYLRLSIETVASLAQKGNLPGRKIENDWRFLKSAIDDWLRSKSSSSILLSQAGALADDDEIAQLRASIYQARERPEIDDNLGSN